MKRIALTSISLLALAGSTLAQCPLDKLLAEGGQGNDKFGEAVAIDGDRAIVGAHLADPNGGGSGAAHIFERTGSRWLEVAKLAPVQTDNNDHFGRSVSILGDTAVVGADSENGPGAEAGAVYFFLRGPSGGWSQAFRVQSSDIDAGDHFGRAVAQTKIGFAEYVFVGASSEGFAGSVYVFQRVGNQWIERQKLEPSNVPVNARFGFSIDTDGSQVLIGAPLDSTGGNDVGSAWIYEFQSPNWTFSQVIRASDGNGTDEFGHALAIEGDHIVVGAHQENGPGQVAGAAYAFERIGGIWVEQQKFQPAIIKGGDRFGSGVALEGNRVLIGALDHHTGSARTGAAFVFDYNGSSWTEVAEISGFDKEGGDKFGIAVALEGGNALIGASAVENQGVGTGGAYTYSLDNSNCTGLIGLPRELDYFLGGPHELYLFAGQQNAGNFYVLLGSLTGTTPGFTIDGLDVPLVIDDYFLYTLINVNNGPMYDSLGFVSGNGQAQGRYDLGTAFYPNLIGLTLHHAALVLSPINATVLWTSNAASFTFV